MATSDDLVLCCLLWAHPGEEAALVSYEDAVLALVPDHGGEVVERVRGDGSSGHPLEVQVFRFPNQAAVDAYLADPRRTALSAERDRTVARTELFPVVRA
ncbi:hypothetical protein [Agromyces larvae]|uniref:DUF1330 domain-containing protein n=1 Tax=Agromyces larvae TaxID=2929802 RepID=A0ABY4BY00_9MICO|nr:hypothetical protein [Agromyces larvae]UOE44106.1 hypothetical protein MTO99_18435 [Agromyces larvae]